MSHSCSDCADVRLVTLTGPGGMGKTRLRMQVASRNCAIQFSDGVFLVALAPCSDPELVVSSHRQTLAIRKIGDQSLLDLLKASLWESTAAAAGQL